MAVSNFGNKGLITGNKLGTTKIHAEYGGRTFSVDVEVIEPSVTAVDVTGGSETVVNDPNGLQLTATATLNDPQNPQRNVTNEAEWAFTPDQGSGAQATVQAGLVKGTAAGAGKVTATHSGKTSAPHPVTIRDAGQAPPAPPAYGTPQATDAPASTGGKSGGGGTRRSSGSSSSR